MNSRTMPASSPPPDAGLPGDFQDLYGLAMDGALGLEKASLSTVVCLNSYVFDMYQDALRFTPVFGNCFGVAAQALAFSMELQMNWLRLLVPHTLLPRVSGMASSSGNQPIADELADSMDMAIGARVAAPRSAAASSSVRKAQPQPTPDRLAYSMDIAIGERFTVSSSTVASTSGSQSPTKEFPEPSGGLAMAAKAGC